jgi:peptidoglycan/xylan/chitin deacetylase (PgdA/CDA1 family)
MLISSKSARLIFSAAIRLTLCTVLLLLPYTSRAQQLTVPFMPTNDWVFQRDNIYEFGLQNTHTIALTFDDGPGEGTVRILALLKKYGIHATFFSIGGNGKNHPELLQQVVAEGHILGNHSYTHPDLGAGTYTQHPDLLIAELKKTDAVIRPFEPVNQNLYFRAPYGSWAAANAAPLNAIPRLARYIGPIYWDIGGEIAYDWLHHMTDAADWDCWDHHMTPAQCMVGYVAKIKSTGGGVILSHDLYANTATMWETLLPQLVKLKYKFVTLDQIPALDKYRQQSKLRTNLARVTRGSN